MEYQLNQQLELPVRELRVDTNTGAQYAVIYDGEREYRIYNLLNCQKESLPEKMYVRVSQVSAFGFKLRQDEGRLFQEHYKVGKLYAFDVKDVKLDHNSDKPYYVIEDDFASHHYYYRDEQKYNVGDSCILEVKGFTDKGFLKLAEVKRSASVVSEQEDKKSEVVQSDSCPVLNGVEEDNVTELKSSIVFPAGGNGVADIDKQLYVILKELTAFMNTEGGTLYIGVHDKTNRILGIKDDYAHLNDGENDEYNGTYQENHDGYELKIRNTIDRLCPSVANDLVTISFEKVDGAEYCKIVVKKAKRPIWLSGTQLYVRQGNRLKLLKGDEITFFITERMSLSIHDIIDVDGLTMPSVGMTEDQLRDVLHTIINQRRDGIPLPPPPSLKEIDYWIVWNEDSTWVRQRSKAEGDVLQLPVYQNMSDPLVVFCYKNNRVNTVKLSDFGKGVNLSYPNKGEKYLDVQKNGWCSGNGKPKNVFLAEPSSLLVVQSLDYHNTESVKLHALTDFTPTQTASSMGAPILPDGVDVLSYSIIGAEHRGKLPHLIVPKAKRSTEKGTPISSPAFPDEINYLKSL